MDRTERFHLIDQMLNNHRVVSRQHFLDVMEISAATFKRDLEYLRDRLRAPIIWDSELRGYRYQQTTLEDKTYQLPGLWFNTAEIQALLTMNAWIENLQQGMLSDHIKPLQSRIRALLDQGDHSIEEITRRIRILTQPRKTDHQEFFQLISQALLNRKRLIISHYNRQSASSSEREISPQRLTFYRDNWYLDSWCHLRQAIRSFAIDAITGVVMLAEPAEDILDAKLDLELASGYGIFSGSHVQWAELKFSPHKARWVAQEQWHPDQLSRFDESGNYFLSLPFSQEPELLMDILKHGAGVEVISPDSLRKRLQDVVEDMSRLYSGS
jgi:predicted DNA-binding transcriptional regulator YafY